MHYGQQAVSIQKEFEGRCAFRKTQAVFEANKRSGRIKNAQLGTTENAVEVGIVNENTSEPGGIYVGVEPDSGLPAFYKGSSPVNIKGPTRTGKSARLAMPIIISNGMGEKPESTFSIDIKGELFSRPRTAANNWMGSLQWLLTRGTALGSGQLGSTYCRI